MQQSNQEKLGSTAHLTQTLTITAAQVGAALRKQTHCCPQLLYLSKSYYGTVRHTEAERGQDTEAERGQAKQQKAAQQHNNSQTLSKHSCEPQKQQKLLFQPREALPELQKLYKALRRRAWGGPSVNCYDSPNTHFATTSAQFLIAIWLWFACTSGVGKHFQTTGSGDNWQPPPRRTCYYRTMHNTLGQDHTPQLGLTGGLCTQAPTALFWMRCPLAQLGVG
jgi:hypothetical protein